MKPSVHERPSPWIVAIAIGFALTLLANAIFIYIAVSGADQVVPSYSAERR